MKNILIIKGIITSKGYPVDALVGPHEYQQAFSKWNACCF